MAEALVSIILQQLATSTIENAQQEWRSLTGVEEDIRKLERNLRAIRALLDDAEEKQMTDPSVKVWLHDVKEASYELEDILDEWNTPLKTNKVISFASCYPFPPFSRRHNIAVKIKKVNEELDEIAKQKNRYQLTRRESKQARRLESTSFVDVSMLHGRDEVKKEIVTALLSEDCRQTISIVGMGGIGKTALAQLIYNDCQVKENFSKLIWVCVSDFFDQFKIARAILESLDQSSTTSPNLVSLQSVLDKICEKIRGEKFFLVLDDVWTDRDENWESFKAIFRQGKSGSRILVTTRKESVVVGMESFRVFNLEKLSDGICWLILRQIAFTGKDVKLCDSLEDVGKEIAKKCKGLPLAAKTLGGLLRGKTSQSEWLNVLNSELWKLNFAQDNIFTPLLLSYYDLPSPIRRCFVYCVIFPKDYEMGKDELIMHWMAQGYLNSDENEEMELLGDEFFNYLASRSLFQNFYRDLGGSILRCKMHDIVHDFVKFLVEDEFFEMKVKCGMLDSSFTKPRHQTFVTGGNENVHIIVNNIAKLRSFVLLGYGYGAPDEVLQKVFNGAKSLRLLKVFRDILIVPKEIGKLIHLRYLKLRSRALKKLPEEVCELHNLQFMSVSHCDNLKKLPDGIGKLINLRHLFTKGCDLDYYPKGISQLTSLRRLYYIKVKASKDPKGFSFGDLENLDLLSGTLYMEIKETTVDMEEAKRANLHNKIHLRNLVIRYLPNSRRSALSEALNPPPNMQLRMI